MIEREALRVFATVAEIGNIKEAAEQLGRTPSARRFHVLLASNTGTCYHPAQFAPIAGC